MRSGCWDFFKLAALGYLTPLGRRNRDTIWLSRLLPRGARNER